MMGHKGTCKSGEDYDLLFAKELYCYLQNNNKTVKYIKRSMIKRLRKMSNDELINQIKEVINE